MNAQPGESSVNASGQHLTFALAGEVFAIPILAVQEIRGWEKVSRTPRLPEYVLGVMNLRDAVVPILDLRARLGMAACERSATAVVIVIRIRSAAADLVTLGCLVDGVSGVIPIAEGDARPMNQLVDALPLTADVRGALLGDRVSVTGALLGAICAYER